MDETASTKAKLTNETSREVARMKKRREKVDRLDDFTQATGFDGMVFSCNVAGLTIMTVF
jgi:hypothetical protein